MDSALPALATVPTLQPACPLAADSAAQAAAGTGFGAILGAVKLTPDQQQALVDLLTAAASPILGELVPIGNGLPAAAMDDLLHAAGSQLLAALPWVSEQDGGAAGAGSEPEGLPAELAALLALLQPAQPATPLAPLPSRQAPPADATGLTPGDPAVELPPALATLRPSTAPPPGAASSAADEPSQATAGTLPLAALVARLRQGLERDAAPDTPAAASDVDDAAAAPTLGGRAPAAAEFIRALRATDTAAAESVGVLAAPGTDLSTDASLPVARPAGDGVPAAAYGRPKAAATVAVPFGERGWERALGDKVVWLVGQQLQAAEVRLNPPHLGPIEVRLTLHGNDASVSFTAANGAVRDALEQAVPRLREMLAEQSLNVVNVDVGQRGGSGHAAQREAHAQLAAAAGDPTDPKARDDAPAMPVLRRSSSNGFVDEYA